MSLQRGRGQLVPRAIVGRDNASISGLGLCQIRRSTARRRILQVSRYLHRRCYPDISQGPADYYHERRPELLDSGEVPVRLSAANRARGARPCLSSFRSTAVDLDAVVCSGNRGVGIAHLPVRASVAEQCSCDAITRLVPDQTRLLLRPCSALARIHSAARSAANTSGQGFTCDPSRRAPSIKYGSRA